MNKRIEALFKDYAVQRPRCNFGSWLACHGYTPEFLRMPNLAMTAAGRNRMPAISFKHADDGPDLHLSLAR